MGGPGEVGCLALHLFESSPMGLSLRVQTALLWGTFSRELRRHAGRGLAGGQRRARQAAAQAVSGAYKNGRGQHVRMNARPAPSSARAGRPPKLDDLHAIGRGAHPQPAAIERDAHGHRLHASATAAGAWPEEWNRVVKSQGPIGKSPAVEGTGEISGKLIVPHEILEPLKRLVAALGTPAADLLKASVLQLARRDLGVSDGFALGFIVRSTHDLRILSVANNPGLTADGVVPIAQAVAMCPRLAALDLSCTGLLRRGSMPGDGSSHGLEATRLDARALSALSASLRKTAVVELSVRGVCMRDKELHLLAPAWSAVANGQQPLRLEILRLGQNELGDAGARELARSLCKVGTLRVLDVSANRIGNAGAAALAQLLDTAPRLRVLCARDNQIGAPGVSALARSTELADWLACLDLGANPVGVGGDAGVGALSKVIGSGGAPRLEQVVLDSCGLGKQSRQRLRAASAARRELPPHPLFGLRRDLELSFGGAP